MSLVRVTGWINRFLANITRSQSDRESMELNPRELKQAEDGIRDRSPSRGLGDVYKRQSLDGSFRMGRRVARSF